MNVCGRRGMTDKIRCFPKSLLPMLTNTIMSMLLYKWLVVFYCSHRVYLFSAVNVPMCYEVKLYATEREVATGSSFLLSLISLKFIHTALRNFWNCSSNVARYYRDYCAEPAKSWRTFPGWRTESKWQKTQFSGRKKPGDMKRTRTYFRLMRSGVSFRRRSSWLRDVQ